MSNTSMSEDERTLSTVVMILLAAMIVPALTAGVLVQAGDWLRHHGVLVPPAQATVTIAWLDAGLDTQRLIIAAAVFVAILASYPLAHRAGAALSSRRGAR